MPTSSNLITKTQLITQLMRKHKLLPAAVKFFDLKITHKARDLSAPIPAA